ncbi:MAG: DUF11 domain-containing protein [Proteobacteria bacterium]|nr:DUF11 domain-containing protein [Pseudomonadota bacterium]
MLRYFPSIRRLVAAWLVLAGLTLAGGPARANQVTNPYFTGTATAATSWTSSATGAGAAFNHALSAPNASIGGTTEFYSGCVGAACLTYPFAAGTTSGAQQVVTVTPGVQYTLSFWTYFSTANNAAVEIDVYWGATKVYAGTSVPTAGWSKQTINLGVAASASNTLTVMIRDDPSYSGITGMDISPVTASLAVTKISTLISDPVNNATNPKMIPGALLEYCILVSNTGSGTATSVVASDPIPASLTYVASSIFTGTSCAGATTAGGASVAGSTLTANIGTLASAASYAIKFRATVN